MTPPLEKAIQLLGSGNWQEAHVIAQADDSAHGCWIHGLVHWLEGDRTNARYWYRRAGRSFPPPGDVAHEIAALETSLATRQSH